MENNKEIVARWFDATWGNNYKPSVIKELAAPDVLMYYPLHGKQIGSSAIIEMLNRLRAAFPDLKFWVVGNLIQEGEMVLGRWEGGGTHTGPAFSDLPAGSLEPNSGKVIRFTGMSLFKLEKGKIKEEIGEEDALKAALQLGVITVTEKS